MLFFYNLAICGYISLIRVFSLFNTKAKLWVEGRKNIFEHLSSSLQPGEKRAWFHFASLGEFEQGRPVLEKYKSLHPEIKIVMTFFSPSGFEIRKNYPLADYIFYLPADTSKNASRFIELINPSIVFFTKYEYWHHYFNQLNKKNIPLYIISAIFRQKQLFFKWYGGFYRNILTRVTHFFLQDEPSAQLLKAIGFDNYTISGDTRFDRVVENTAKVKPIEVAGRFINNQKVIVAGSTWPEDETIICDYINHNIHTYKWIIAPHEINENKLASLEAKLKAKHIRFSQTGSQDLSTFHVLIIDNIGMLSSLYQYSFVTYIGGGFGKGIHNILEAAAFGMPVVFGPNYQKFKEAHDLIHLDSAIAIHNSEELNACVDLFFNNSGDYQRRCEVAATYVSSNAGATDKIIKFIS